MPACRCSLPCGLPSSRGAGRTPADSSPPSSSVIGQYSVAAACGGGVFRNLAVYFFSLSFPFPVLVAVFRFRRTPLAVPTLSKEWWVTVARTTAIDCCSCLSRERNRRSLRRRALPVPPSAPCAAMGLCRPTRGYFIPLAVSGGTPLRPIFPFFLPFSLFFHVVHFSIFPIFFLVFLEKCVSSFFF